jgi:hypothetical protein
MLIRNVTEFANYIGAIEPTQPAISRAVYNATKCGAGCEFEVERGRVRPATVHFRITRSIVGYVVMARRGRREWISPLWLAELQGISRKSQDYITVALALDSRGRIPSDTLSEFKLSALAKAIGEHLGAEPEGWVVSGAGSCDKRAVLHVKWTRAEVFVPYIAPQVVGIRVGAIVEGPDADATPFTLRFPFTTTQYSEAISELEYECSVMWEEANGDWAQIEA